MTAAALPSHTQGNPHAKVLAALPGAARGSAASARSADGEAGPAVDFASVLRDQLPAPDDFAALQAVQAALAGRMPEAATAATELGGVVTHVGALIAEIHQAITPIATAAPLPALGLPPTAPAASRNDARPLAPVANLLVDDPLPGAPGAASRPHGDAQLSAEVMGNAADPTRELPDHAGPGQWQTADAPRFKLPETPALVLSHALSSGHHVQGATAPNAPAGQVQLALPTPVHSPQWSSELGQNLVWMSRNDIHTAQLSVNPPHLGPIEITLTLNKEMTSAHFVSPLAEVREILEEALPRLREILEGAGVRLGDADVGAESRRQFGNPAAGSQSAAGDGFPLEGATLQGRHADNHSAETGVRMGNRLVDIFV